MQEIQMKQRVVQGVGGTQIRVSAPANMGKNGDSRPTPDDLLQECGEKLARCLKDSGLSGVDLRIQPYRKGNNEPAGLFRRRVGSDVYLTFRLSETNLVDAIAHTGSDREAAIVKNLTLDRDKRPRQQRKRRRSDDRSTAQSSTCSRRALRRGRSH